MDEQKYIFRSKTIWKVCRHFGDCILCGYTFFSFYGAKSVCNVLFFANLYKIFYVVFYFDCFFRTNLNFTNFAVQIRISLFFPALYLFICLRVTNRMLQYEVEYDVKNHTDFIAPAPLSADGVVAVGRIVAAAWASVALWCR